MIENKHNTDQENHEQSNINNQDVEKQGQLFLILGIVLAFCCNLYFGVAVILINELKYKPLLKDGNDSSARSTKNIMIVLAVCGFILGLLLNVLGYILEYLVAVV